MYDKLESIKERYNTLSEQLSTMEVISNQDKFRELSQEHSSISEIVHLYDRLCTVNKNIGERGRGPD
jgi:peptide chain release factor 1